MLLDDIADYLETQGIGTVGVDIFKGEMSDEPSNCVAIERYAGKPPDTLGYEYPGLQVRVRNTSRPDAEAKIKSIESLLHCLSNITLNGTRYLSLFAQQGPVPLGRDESNRIDLVQNYIITKER